MAAGRLNTELTLYPLTSAPDGYGGTTETAGAAIENVWGEVKPASWKQAQTALGRNLRITHAITLRFDEELAQLPNELRVTFEDHAGQTRTLWVKTKLDGENSGRWLVLGADEGGPT